jgi:hypothetical protein
MIFPPGQCREYLQAGQQPSATAKKKEVGLKKGIFRVLLPGG